MPCTIPAFISMSQSRRVTADNVTSTLSCFSWNLVRHIHFFGERGASIHKRTQWVFPYRNSSACQWPPCKHLLLDDSQTWLINVYWKEALFSFTESEVIFKEIGAFTVTPWVPILKKSNWNQDIHLIITVCLHLSYCGFLFNTEECVVIVDVNEQEHTGRWDHLYSKSYSHLLFVIASFDSYRTSRGVSSSTPVRCQRFSDLFNREYLTITGLLRWISQL